MQLAPADAGEVRVGVGQAGEHRRAREVDRPGAGRGALEGFRRGAHEGDATAVRDDGLGGG